MSSDLERIVKEKSLLISRVETEIQRVVVGQANMINRLLIGLFANGHILLEGVPGLAKTLTVASLAKALHLTFKRIQFTPDLLPADVVGTLIFNQKELRFDVRKGPIFANIVLADEINRSPAKVQSALLEAMQEKQVTIGEQTYLLEKPFLVLATQNPLEQEGTYPLPEAQMDRFMMKIYVNYPTKAEEKEIMRRMAKVDSSETVQPVLDAKEILAIRRLIDQIHLSERLEDYIVDIIMATREPGLYGLTPITKYLAYGVSPRATIALNLAAKTYALVKGRTHVLPEDIKEVAPDVLNHRLILTYDAEADRISGTQLVQQILKQIKI